MKVVHTGILLGSLAFGSAMAADYSVGIVHVGTGFAGAGTALNLYSITHRGVHLVEGPYVFQQPVPPNIDETFEPVLVSMSPEHDFAYVVYVRVPSLPILVQFAITPHGLVYRWQQEVSTGDASLQGSSIGTVAHHVIEYTYPADGLWVHIIDQDGQELVSDPGSNGHNLVSARIDPNGKYYYSCRFISASDTGVNGPANSVAVYKLENYVTGEAPPWFSSTDPVFVQSECN